jgi:hypothetical protein
MYQIRYLITLYVLEWFMSKHFIYQSRVNNEKTLINYGNLKQIILAMKPNNFEITVGQISICKQKKQM